MRILVTWGTERGGTEEIARIIAEQLRAETFDVDAIPTHAIRGLDAYDAAIVGGALYANRWHRDARRFVRRNTEALRRIPVWLFSSGPLDDSAERETIPPTNQVKALAERVGARGHVTFGGRLAPDARGFPASAMARTYAGDWRNPDRIRAWAVQVARELPSAGPGRAVDHPARSLSRLAGHVLIGWAQCAALLAALLALTTEGLAFGVHAVAAPLIFAAVSRRYFDSSGAREPLPVAPVFAGVAATLQLPVIAWLIPGGLTGFSAAVGAALPGALILASTWITGFIVSTLPWPDKTARAAAKPAQLAPRARQVPGSRA